MNEFLDAACLGYDQRDGPGRTDAARARLADDAALADASIFTASALGRTATVVAMLGDDPGLATRRGGPRDWPPLMYLTYSRVDARRPGESYVDTAAALLDAGADPDSHWLWGGTYRFTALTGCFGEGEGGVRALPEHVEGFALAELLLDAGANPNDGQALYNRMFTPGSACLELLLRAGLRPSDRINWPADNPSSRTTMSYQLFAAVRRGFEQRVALLIDAGADLTETEDGMSLWKAAMLGGHPALAERVAAAGVAPEVLDAVDACRSALCAADIAAVQRLVQTDATLLDAVERRHGDPLADAAAAGNVSLLRLLVGNGLDLNRNAHCPAAHQAAMHGHLDALKYLVGEGADPRRRDERFEATALGWARHAGQDETAAWLQTFGLTD